MARFMGVVVLAGVGVSLGARSASAADDGPTYTDQICMQKTFGAPVTGANKLNCTANDIRIARAVNVSQATCIKGSTFDLTATFEVNVTANARYDAGFFFRLDGGATARGDGLNATGECSLSLLTPLPKPTDGALNLDGDACGDFNSGLYEVTFTIPDVVCEAGPNSDLLRLPNCTSWHSNAGTVCNLDNAFDTKAEAFQLHPDTKSKCACDDTFTVPVKVVPATITVQKDAVPTQVPEPGGDVTYTVTITNNSPTESVTITSVLDTAPDKDLGTNTPWMADNTCPALIGKSLAPGATVDCTYKAPVTGDVGARITDTATAYAKQDGIAELIWDADDASVDITDIYEEPTLYKTAQSVANCQMEAKYQVVVNNNSALDKMTIKSLIDNRFGDITQVSATILETYCALPLAPIDPMKNFSCTFVGLIKSDSCNFNHTNTITAKVIDDDNQPGSASDDATVTLTATP